MKKMFGVFVLGIFMIAMLGGLVSAREGGAFEPVQDAVVSVYKTIEPVLEFAIGTTEGAPELFFAKVLLGIIIFGIVFMALKKIKFLEDSPWVLWTINIAVSLLSIRWMGGADIVNTILLPYSALGVALTAGIPFVVYFLVVKDFEKTMRKVSWIFFIVIFLSLWVMRTGTIVEGTADIGGPVGAFAWIYLATAGLAIIMLFFDGTIQKILGKIEVEKGDTHRKRKQERFWKEELEKVDAGYKRDATTYKSIYEPSKPDGLQAYNADVKYLQDRMADLRT